MIYSAIGRRMRGKSTLARHITLKIPQRVNFDPRGQFDTGAPRATNTDQIRENFARMWEDETFAEFNITPDEDLQACFEEMCKCSKAWMEQDPERPLAVLIDEARFVKFAGVKTFDWMLRCSPPEVVHIVITCHRPTDIDPDIRAIVDHWLLFRCVEESDLETIRKRCGSQVADEVAKLDAYQWVHWNDGKGEARTRKDASTWFVPLKSHPVRHPVNTFESMGDGDPLTKSTLF